ncbi:glycine cleavage system protein T [Planktomarina temperata]|jgi:glycine cleavage system aminomethyltransferase T|uniref:glycine cleavage T C-terminal barrel domain-containing protein n=1 Tax=Planktomarina TaxID=1284657 RepID=UPI000E856EA1|nr:glycine cleavage system protein T [Planktomarina temperata]MDA8839973.1 glycine cleavage system protein T [bacterium]MDC3221901.1 glycine cleavage system protein T [Planktomarina sp.]MDA7455024.1 glycine cleavage system protein T [Planktomarina temperata]MDA7461232.1 glycine cleavage system protein T [Planktomarina temperata]
MTQADDFGFGTQIRKSPYFDATVRWGAQGFSVYNHMYIPRDFGDPEQNFWNLVDQAILCDVAVERQVEITGPDAAKFTQMLTCRDLSKMAVGQCKYILITNADGGILNDPILLRLAENHFWISLADSDILLWAQGVAVHSGLNVQIKEPDVSPLQLQGPNSGLIMQELFGDSITDLKYYWLRELELEGIPLVVSRTGWSSELGYELYLRDGSKGDQLWELIMAAGASHGLKPGHTSSIRRIEGGMLSYHADADIDTNPFELGFDRLVNLDMDAEFIGKAALRKIKQEGPMRKQVGLVLDCAPLTGPNTTFWAIQQDGATIGKVTSAVYSPRLKQNIALAMVATNAAIMGAEVEVLTNSGAVKATMVERPFYDPKKQIAAA